MRISPSVIYAAPWRSPRKSFYRYFSSKDGALFALLDHTMLEFYEEGLRTGGGTAQGDLQNFFRFWYDRRDLLEALTRNHLSGILVERATALALREHLMQNRLKTMPIDVQSMALSFSICGLMTMTILWHQQGYRISPSEMAHIATSLLTQPLPQS